MAEQPTLSPNALFEGPTPGASLTTEPGNRPWENPPKESSLDRVINNYLGRLKNQQIIMPILDAVRYGTSITTIVESVIETAVMEGEHTIDIGILAAPVLVEYLKQACEVSDIKYNLSHIDAEKARKPKAIDNRLLEEVLREMKDEKDSPIQEQLETSAEEIKSESKGLMSRKPKKEDNKDGD